MDLQKLFSMQKILDERIASQHQLIGQPLIAEKILALEVELCELANETRCFKYWSTKPPAPPEVILEEYVDGLHFILSLGLSLHFTDVLVLEEHIIVQGTLVSSFQHVLNTLVLFQQNSTYQQFENVLHSYLALGKKLGFTTDEIEKAYVLKNEVNHKRQDEGY